MDKSKVIMTIISWLGIKMPTLFLQEEDLPPFSDFLSVSLPSPSPRCPEFEVRVELYFFLILLTFYIYKAC